MARARLRPCACDLPLLARVGVLRLRSMDRRVMNGVALCLAGRLRRTCVAGCACMGRCAYEQQAALRLATLVDHVPWTRALAPLRRVCPMVGGAHALATHAVARWRHRATVDRAGLAPSQESCPCTGRQHRGCARGLKVEGRRTGQHGRCRWRGHDPGGWKGLQVDQLHRRLRRRTRSVCISAHHARRKAKAWAHASPAPRPRARVSWCCSSSPPTAAASGRAPFGVAPLQARAFALGPYGTGLCHLPGSSRGR